MRKVEDKSRYSVVETLRVENPKTKTVLKYRYRTKHKITILHSYLDFLLYVNILKNIDSFVF